MSNMDFSPALEILSPGLRSVEDSADETGQKSPVHCPIDGSLQHEMCHMWGVHLQREEVQCTEGGCGE